MTVRHPHTPTAVRLTARQLRISARVSREFDDAVRDAAAVRLDRRLLCWYGDVSLAPVIRPKDVSLEKGFVVLHQEADTVERAILSAIAITAGDHQFGVNSRGEVFASADFGLSPYENRQEVVHLSPGLDAAARTLLNDTGGKGGRFYERDGVFFKPLNARSYPG